jgi:DNA-binding response OmpR family regulator
MARLLRNLGYEVSVANSVAAARSLASEYQFDLLVSDIGLPDESGMELMRHVRQEYKLPGIALTGFGTERDRAEILASGFSEVLVKPVDFKQLRAAITRVG